MMQAGAQSHELGPGKLGKGDAIGITFLVCALLLVGYLRSRNCMFWGDELMGYETVTQPTLTKLLLFWHHGIDSSGIWFFVFGRPWIDLFGATEVTLRMFSAAAVAGSAAVLWLAARRKYTLLPVAASIGMTYAFLKPLRWQLANGRSYGMLMLAVAIVSYLQLRGEDAEQDRPTPLFLLATFCAYTLLCGTHILGIMYVLSMLGMQCAIDLSRRRFRPLLYISALLSLWVTFISLANLHATLANGKPSFWTIRPSLHDLFSIQGLIGRELWITTVLPLAVVFFSLRARQSRKPIYIVIVSFGIVDVAMFLISRFTTSIYVDRYMLPLTIALIYAMCELLTQLREADLRWPRLRAWVPVIYIACALASLFWKRLQPRLYPVPNYTAQLVPLLTPDLPIIDTDVDTFLSLEFYQHAKTAGRLQFPVDWEVALDPATTGGVSGFHEMDNWRDVGLYPSDIVSTATALAGKRDFLVLASPNSLVWLNRRVLSNPNYEAKLATEFASTDFHTYVIWRVHQK